MKHEHKWGTWLHPDGGRIDWQMAGTYRFCINGMCPWAQYRNGRLVKLRLERATVQVPGIYRNS